MCDSFVTDAPARPGQTGLMSPFYRHPIHFGMPRVPTKRRPPVNNAIAASRSASQPAGGQPPTLTTAQLLRAVGRTMLGPLAHQWHGVMDGKTGGIVSLSPDSSPELSPTQIWGDLQAIIQRSKVFQSGKRWVFLSIRLSEPGVGVSPNRTAHDALRAFPQSLLKATGIFYEPENAPMFYTDVADDPRGHLQFFATRDKAEAGVTAHTEAWQARARLLADENIENTDSGPRTYADYRAECERVFDGGREAVGRVLEPALNAEAQQRPRHTYEEKKELAKWINGELRRFGLALKGPRTDRPCLLMGNPGGRPGFGRFVLEYTDEAGKRHHPLTSVELPGLTLMLDDLTRSSYQSPKRAR